MKNISEIFLKKLRDNENHIGMVYYQLFSLVNHKELDETIIYLFHLSIGDDEYFKEYGKENWFAIWHKSVRQTNFFSDNFRKIKMPLLTADETKEFKFLSNKCSEKGYIKESIDGKHLFNDEYRRYLDLFGKRRRENADESINGNLDSILWNMVHVDKEDILIKTFEYIFIEIN